MRLLQTELLLQRNVMQGKGKEKTRTTEFKEHFFHVLSEAHEPVFRMVLVDDNTGEIVVRVLDGNEFVVKCVRR